MTKKHKGVIIEPEDADTFVMHLPDDTYVVVFPFPLCDCKHKTAEEAATCKKVNEKVEEDKRNSRFTNREGYL